MSPRESVAMCGREQAATDRMSPRDYEIARIVRDVWVGRVRPGVWQWSLDGLPADGSGGARLATLALIDW